MNFLQIPYGIGKSEFLLGENGDAESDINRKGNQKNRSQKSRENRIEDSYQDQQSKQKVKISCYDIKFCPDLPSMVDHN